MKKNGKNWVAAKVQCLASNTLLMLIARIELLRLEMVVSVLQQSHLNFIMNCNAVFSSLELTKSTPT